MIRIRTQNDQALDVPPQTTVAQVVQKLAAAGLTSPQSLQLQWTADVPHPGWGAPWPGADFSGDVSL